MRIPYLISIVLLFLCQLVVAQDSLKIDSLKRVANESKWDTLRVDAMNELVLEILTGDPPEATRYWKQGMNLSEEIGYIRGIAQGHYNYGYLKVRLGKMDSAHWHFSKSRDYGEQVNDAKIVGTALSAKGATSYHQGDLDIARISLLAAIDVLININEERALARSWLNLGNVYYDLTDYDSAKLFYEKALFVFDSLDDHPNSAMSYQNIGNIYESQNNYPKALDYFLRSLRVSESIQDSIGIAYILGGIGNVYQNQDETNLALKYHFRAREIKEKLGMTYSLIFSEYNLGWIYISMEEYERAEEHLINCLETSQAMSNPSMAAFALSGLGEVYLHLNQYDLAKAHLDSARNIRAEMSLKKDLAATLNLLGKLAHQQKQFAKSINHLEEALSIGQELKVPELIKISSQYAGELYAEIGNYKKAYESHVLYKAMDDTIKNEANTRKIALLESEYEFEKEKEQMELANEQSLTAKAHELQQQRYFTYASTAGFLSILIIAFFIYQNYRQKQRTNSQLLEKNNEIQHQAVELEHKNQDLKELSTFKQGLTDMIAHDMKNPLNVVIGLSEGNPDPNKMKQVNQSGKLMLQMVTNMLDIQKFDQAEMQLNLAPHTLLDMLVQAKFQVELLAMARSVQLDFQVSQDIQLSCDREVILRVLVNLFTNGIKYATPGSHIQVNAQLAEERVLISVSDTGKGIHSDDLPFVFDKFWQSEAKKSGQIQSTGLGLTFCKIAIEAHHGTISVDSTLGEGSTFHFDLAQGQTAPIAKELKVGLPPSEFKTILNIIDEIRQIPLYQFAEIENTLSRIEDNSPSMTLWKESVITAALNWNEVQFEALLTQSEIVES